MCSDAGKTKYLSMIPMRRARSPLGSVMVMTSQELPAVVLHIWRRRM